MDSPESPPVTCSSFALIAAHAESGAALRRDFFASQADGVREAAFKTALALARGRKILLCGNGGSAADAQHIAAEFVNRFLLDRPPLPALALSTDTSILTAVGNDFGFDQIYAKQVQAMGQPEDVLIGISTSGNSANVLAALRVARQRGMITIGLTGQGGGLMPPLCDVLLTVPHASTPLVQEMHIAAGHLICMLVDHFLFENITELTSALENLPQE